MTTRVAADHLGIGVSTLQSWAAKGIVKPAWRTPGGLARWDLQDLERQLDMPPRPAEEAAHESAASDPPPATATPGNGEESASSTNRNRTVSVASPCAACGHRGCGATRCLALTQDTWADAGKTT